MTGRACAAERDRWLATKPSTLIPRFGIAHGSGAPQLRPPGDGPVGKQFNDYPFGRAVTWLGGTS